MGDRVENSKSRTMVWTSDVSFQGWICDQCEWSDPLPTLLNDPEAKSAFDRLATRKFQEHSCSEHLMRVKTAQPDSFTTRIKKMISHGYKPKDAVELLLQELMLEYRDKPKLLEQARLEGEDFLRRIRAGLI
jgi:isocitrate dehydrogenase kinase/phosphatase